MFSNTNLNMGNCAVSQTCHSTCETCHTNSKMMNNSCGQMMNNSCGQMMNNPCGQMMNNPCDSMMGHPNCYNK